MIIDHHLVEAKESQVCPGQVSGGKSFPQIARSGFQSQVLLSSTWCQVTGFLYMEKNERGEVVVSNENINSISA